MKPFNLTEYLANPSKKIVTRDGKDVRIICIDRKVDSYTKCPIVALITNKEGSETSAYFTKNGKYMDGSENPLDLFFALQKNEGWINIFKPYGYFSSDTVIFSNEELAKQMGKNDKYYVTTIKIEWEE